MPTHANEGVSSTAKRVADHARALVGLEVELAKMEVKRKVAAMGIGIGLAVVAGVLALLGLVFLLAAGTAALATMLDVWLAILVVGGALLVVAGLLSAFALAALRAGAPPVPEQAIEEARLTTDALKAANGRS